MPLLSRFSRLFKADLHAVLDRMEEPETLLKQNLREMEEALAHDSSRLSKTETEIGETTEKLEELRFASKENDERIELCFQSSQETLAKNLVRRKLEIRHQLKVYTRRLASLENSLKEQASELDKHSRQFARLKDQVSLLEKQRPQTDRNVFPLEIVDIDSAIREEDVEVAFLHEKKIRNKS